MLKLSMEENSLQSFHVSSIMNIKKYQVYRYITKTMQNQQNLRSACYEIYEPLTKSVENKAISKTS